MVSRNFGKNRLYFFVYCMISPKSKKNIFFYYQLSIYRSTRLEVLIKNMYWFYVFELNLNEISWLKGLQIKKIKCH